MARYSRSRSRTPPKRRGRRSYSSSTSSRSRSRSRSLPRGRPKYQSQSKKTSRGRSRSRSRSPPRKDHGGRAAGSGYKGTKQQKRRSRSYSPRNRHFGGSTSKPKSRSPSTSRRNERYKSPQGEGRDNVPNPNKTINYRPEEQSYLPPKTQLDPRAGFQGGSFRQSHQDNRLREPHDSRLPPEDDLLYRDDFGKGVQVQGQLPLTSNDATYNHPSSQSKYGPHSQPAEKSYMKDSYREKEKMKYEAVSPEDLHFASKSPQRSGSPYDRKITKVKGEPQPKSYFQSEEKYGPAEPQKVKMAQAPIIRPIFDPYLVKIPRRKDEGLKSIFDRPELKERCVPEQPEVSSESRLVAVAEKKEPVVYRQDVHFTGSIPSGTFPSQSRDFMERERREPIILDFEPRRDAYFVPNPQYPQRGNPVVVGSQLPSQSSTYQVQPNESFQSMKDVQHLADYRQATYVHAASPAIAPSLQNNLDDSVSYQYPPDDLPDFKGPHDLRHDLETRRKQMEQQQVQGRMRSISKSRSRSRSRPRSYSRSRSPLQHYRGSSYKHSRSRSRGSSEDMRSGERRPVRERLGDISKRTRDNSFSDDGGKKADWRNKQKSYFFHDNNRKDNRSKSRERDSRDNYKDNTATKYQGSTRGFRGGRGTRGYLGKNFIPGFSRGMRGRYQRGGRGFGKGDNSSRTWTHDLFDKERDESRDSDGAESKKDRKKQKKDGKEKEKKQVKQKIKKGKKTKKSPSRTEEKNKDSSLAPMLK